MAGHKTSFVFREASAGEDEALRRLWRETPMAGSIALAFEREPSVFLAASLMGDLHQTLVALDEHGHARASASRAELSAYVNGVPELLGYLSELRVHPSARQQRRLLLDGWAHLRELHRRAGVQLYVTTIFADNQLARRMLERNRPGWPVYLPRERLATLAALPRLVAAPLPQGIMVRQALPSDRAGLLECLARNHARYQFAPVWTEATLTGHPRSRGLDFSDFTIALRDQRVVGVLAIWDQQAFKQTIVHGYHGAMTALRHVWNMTTALSHWPRLPAPGQALSHAYLSHLAVDDDAAPVFLALCRHALSRRRPFEYLTFTLSERHPLLAVAEAAFRHLRYDSILYAVHLGDGAREVARLDTRPAYLEAAIL